MDPGGPQEQDQEQRQGQESKPAVTYTAAADGVNNTATSTKIIFTFSEPLTGLTGDAITLTNDDGTVTKGELSGSGITWTLGISVNTGGNVKVKITKPGIEAAEKAVTVFKEGTQSVIDYTVAANGSNSKTSDAIIFTFGAAVEGLSANDITLTNNGGVVEKGNTLIGEGQTRSLKITVKTAGEVKVKIIKEGIKTDEKPLTVYKTLSLTPAIEFVNETYSSGTTFDTSSGQWTGQGTAQERWTLNANDQGRVYFAVYKEAAQTITVSGSDAARVNQAANGVAVDGQTPSDTLSVFTVNMGDLAFDGGRRTFTLNVNETGALSRTVTVTLNVQPNETGAAVFKLVNKEEAVEFMERVGGDFDGLVSAFTWVENNAAANTEYTIRVEKNETNLPHFIVSLNSVGNVVLRLRGTQKGPWILEPADVHITSLNTSVESINIKNVTKDYSFLQIGGDTSYPKMTFILGNNITIKSGTIANIQGLCINLIQVYANAALVLEPGSKITGHNFTNSTNAVINVKGMTNANRELSKNGQVRIEGGAITNCQVNSGGALIRFQPTKKNTAIGSFYLAGGSVVTLEDNNYNTFNCSGAVNLDVVNGMSLPAD
jgi:hypothetical protein